MGRRDGSECATRMGARYYYQGTSCCLVTQCDNRPRTGSQRGARDAMGYGGSFVISAPSANFGVSVRTRLIECDEFLHVSPMGSWPTYLTCIKEHDRVVF